MAGSFSDYTENKVLDHVLGVASFTPPTIYIGLGTGADDTGLTGEPSSGGYARIAHSSWNAAASRAITNNGIITFAQATGAWGTMTHYGVFDALTGGNLIGWGELNTSKSIVAGNTASIADEEISVSWNTGGLSNYLANEILDHIFGNGAYTQPTIYLAFSTADPTDDASGLTEPSGNNYARKAHASWNAASAGVSTNNGVITFNTPSGSWGTITHLAIMDALTSGNMLLYGTATPNQEPDSGDTVQYDDEDLDITLS